MKINWTDSDQNRAKKEGWYICMSCVAIHAWAEDGDDEPVFKNNAEAAAFVATDAIEGCCATCMKAVGYLFTRGQDITASTKSYRGHKVAPDSGSGSSDSDSSSGDADELRDLQRKYNTLFEYASDLYLDAYSLVEEINNDLDRDDMSSDFRTDLDDMEEELNRHDHAGHRYEEIAEEVRNSAI